MGTNILVLWAMFTIGPIQGIEYKHIKYESGSRCAVAQMRVKLGNSWNSHCMTEEQFYTFRQLQ